MPACEAQNPAKRFKLPTFCNWLTYLHKIGGLLVGVGYYWR